MTVKFENKVRHHKQTFGKIATTVVCYDQGCNDIGVVIATKLRHYLLYSHWELFFQNRSQELFPAIVALMFVKLKRNL